MKRKQKISKAARRRLVILIPVTILVVAYFFVSLSYYAIKIYQLKHEEKVLTTELTNLQDNEDELKTNIEKLQNPDYLARYARENYHYSKDGELVIQRKEQEEKKKTEEKKDYQNETVITICTVILLLVIVYIFRKSKRKNKNSR